MSSLKNAFSFFKTNKHFLRTTGPDFGWKVVLVSFIFLCTASVVLCVLLFVAISRLETVPVSSRTSASVKTFDRKQLQTIIAGYTAKAAQLEGVKRAASAPADPSL